MRITINDSCIVCDKKTPDGSVLCSPCLARNPNTENVLIALLGAHPTPTDVIARALRVLKVDITLYTHDENIIVVRGDAAGN